VLTLSRLRSSLAGPAFGSVLTFSLFAIGVTTPAGAAPITYTYTGQPFTNFSGTFACTAGVGECGFSGSFTVATALGDNLAFPTSVTPLSYSFTDGVQTLTDSNSSIENFSSTLKDFLVSTGPTGAIQNWAIGLLSSTGAFEFLSNNFFDPSPDMFDEAVMETTTPPITALGSADNGDSPGNWSSSSAVGTPEPSSWSLSLLGLGLLCAAGARLKRGFEKA
jgi:hypothetical protein